jgi:hypothetical protein
MRALILSLLFASRALACSCLSPPPISQSLESSDYVIYGRCISFVIHDDSTRLARFEVVRVFKGEKIKEVCEVRTGIDGASCGFNFIAGHSYIVYGHATAGKLMTNICTRTKSGGPERISDDSEYQALDLMTRHPRSKWKEFDPKEDKTDPFK